MSRDHPPRALRVSLPFASVPLSRKRTTVDHLASLISDARSRLRRGARAATYYAAAARRANASGHRLVVFGQGRTGSTGLEDLVCSTGQFVKKGEVLNTAKRGEVRWPGRFVRGMSRHHGAANVMFHVKIYQLTEQRSRPLDADVFMHELAADGWKIVYLRRRDVVRHVLSNVIAENRGATHKFDDGVIDLKVHIDCDIFVERVRARLEYERQERWILGDLDFHEVVYEDDLEHPDFHQRTVDRILAFVGLESGKVETAHRKVAKGPLSEIVRNYDEFAFRLTEEGLSEFLPDVPAMGDAVVDADSLDADRA